MPSICAQNAGLCAADPDCEDLDCPGRPQSVDTTLLATRFCDGGHLVNGEDAEPLPAAIPTPEDVAGWTTSALVCIGLFALACFIAAACYGVQFIFPFE